jgi:drug/metabolite transporter (DMT)-like permease
MADERRVPPGAGADDADGARLVGGGESIGALLGRLWRETATLVQEEVELARAEMAEKATHAAVSMGAIAIGGAVLFAGFIVLLLAAVNALGPLLPPNIAHWLAPAIVGLVVIVIGFVMVTGGIKALDMKDLAPRRTMDSLRRDTDMVKEHV